MGKKVTWICDNANCTNEMQAWDLPPAWLSVVFYNHSREYRYSLCSYDCLKAWAQSQQGYYGDRTESVGAANKIPVASGRKPFP